MNDKELLDIARGIYEFKKGDRVVLLDGGGNFPLFGFRDGSTYTVRNPNYNHSTGMSVEITRGNGGTGFARREQLRKVGHES